LRPLSREVEERVLQKFRLDWNYHSNAIEGNPYTYGETVAFLMEGITAKGKTLKDHLDIKGHDDAIHYLLGVVKDKDYRLTESEIRGLHKMLLKEPYFSEAVTTDGKTTRKEIQLGAYKSAPNHVKTPTGAIHYYASPEETPIKMGELVEWFNLVSTNRDVHPVVIASLFHHEFTAIHPFDDGNGRMARLLMNLVLMQNGLPPIVIKQQDRNNYYQVLRRADTGEYEPLIEYNAESLVLSLNIYLRGAQGSPIDDIEDVDKEIALFKLTLGRDLPEQKANEETIRIRLKNSIAPLFQQTVGKLNKEFADLFFENKVSLYGKPGFSIPDGFYRSTADYLSVTSQGWLTSIVTPIENLTLMIEYLGFKKGNNSFNMRYELPVFFDEFKYRVNYQKQGRILIDKFYQEDLSSSEIQSIVIDSLKNLFSELKQLVDFVNKPS
jgi:Fic family protein